MNIADRISNLLEALPIPTKVSLDRRREEKAEAEAEAEVGAEIGDAGVDDAASDLLTAEMPGDEAPGAPGAPEAPPEVPGMPEVPPPGTPAPAAPAPPAPPAPESEEESSGPEKTERIDMRIKPSDKAEIEAAASNLGLTVSAYVMFLHKSYGGRVGMPSPVQQQPQPQQSQQPQQQP